jgi:hypothetical protein
MTTKKLYVQVKEWWIDQFGDGQSNNGKKILTLHSFLTALKEEKVQMLFVEINDRYRIVHVIEGDTLLVKHRTYGYCMLYPRHNTFIRLIVPFEDDYMKDLLKEEN